MSSVSIPFWFNQPGVLLDDDTLTELWPRRHMSTARKLNAMTRLIVLLTLAGFLVTRSWRFLISGAVTLAAIVLVYWVQWFKSGGSLLQEAFAGNDTSISQIYDTAHRMMYTEPTVQNALMNVQLPEIDDNPQRKEAAPAYRPKVEFEINRAVKKMVTEQFDDPNIDQRLFRDLGDNFEFDRNMRQFYATASTTVPNDQDGFAKFCYGDMIACRDVTNNEMACTRNMPPRWQNV